MHGATRLLVTVAPIYTLLCRVGVLEVGEAVTTQRMWLTSGPPGSAHRTSDERTDNTFTTSFCFDPFLLLQSDNFAY